MQTLHDSRPRWFGYKNTIWCPRGRSLQSAVLTEHPELCNSYASNYTDSLLQVREAEQGRKGAREEGRTGGREEGRKER
ncbi:hypothetical protein EYF80_034581 [Liparis tanakae]|uniref:Uncharacterized protein n=1 Tax=Liparis tanakae TaxID=230148 RepID=A0A4Z2GNK4_9TELE|nr:hypothetical protein EYF80_034581 [Liparis tanakae]